MTSNAANPRPLTTMEGMANIARSDAITTRFSAMHPDLASFEARIRRGVEEARGALRAALRDNDSENIRADPGIIDAVSMETQREAVDKFIDGANDLKNMEELFLSVASLVAGAPMRVRQRERSDNPWRTNVVNVTVTHQMAYRWFLEYTASVKGTWHVRDQAQLEAAEVPGLLHKQETATGVIPLAVGPLSQRVVEVLSRSGLLDFVVWHAVDRTALSPPDAAAGALTCALDRLLDGIIRHGGAPSTAELGAMRDMTRTLRAVDIRSDYVRAVRAAAADYLRADGLSDAEAEPRLHQAQAAMAPRNDDKAAECSTMKLLAAVAQLDLERLGGAEQSVPKTRLRRLARAVAARFLSHIVSCHTRALGARAVAAHLGFGNLDDGSARPAVRVHDALYKNGLIAWSMTRLVMAGMGSSAGAWLYAELDPMPACIEYMCLEAAAGSNSPGCARPVAPLPPDGAEATEAASRGLVDRLRRANATRSVNQQKRDGKAPIP